MGGETGGYEESIVVDAISVNEDKYVLVVESKRSNLGVAMKQCLLALKDMKDSNSGGGEVYGFITTGEVWQMLSSTVRLFRCHVWLSDKFLFCFTVGFAVGRDFRLFGGLFLPIILLG